MMKSVVAGLLGAAMLMPVAAWAQDGGLRGAMRQRMQARIEAGGAQAPGDRGDRAGWQRRDDRGDRGERTGWQRRDAPDGPRAETPRRPDNGGARFDGPRPQPGVDRAQNGAPALARPDRDWGDRRGGVDSGGRRADIPRVGQERDWRDEAARRGQVDRWTSRRVDRRDFNRDRAGFYDRQAWANRGWDDRGWDDRGRDDRGWNDQGFGGRAGWSREWRRDARYDWNRYRATNRAAYRLPRYYAPYGWNGGYRRFGIGAILSSLLFAQSYWIDDPYSYRLPEAYGPYRWVRYYNDALLVDVESGEVVDAINDLFW